MNKLSYSRLANPDTVIMSLSPMHQIMFIPFEEIPSISIGDPFPVYPDSLFEN
jgi:hypothetical protein